MDDLRKELGKLQETEEESDEEEEDRNIEKDRELDDCDDAYE